MQRLQVQDDPNVAAAATGGGRGEPVLAADAKHQQPVLLQTSKALRVAATLMETTGCDAGPDALMSLASLGLSMQARNGSSADGAAAAIRAARRTTAMQQAPTERPAHQPPVQVSTADAGAVALPSMGEAEGLLDDLVYHPAGWCPLRCASQQSPRT